MRRTPYLHVTVLQIERHKIFYTKTTMKKCCSESRKGLFFVSISLIDLFANSSGSKDRPHGVCCENGKWFNEGDVVQLSQVSFDV
jgi:hypothetical protein